MCGKLDSKEKLNCTMIKLRDAVEDLSRFVYYSLNAYCDNFTFHSIRHINYACLSSTGFQDRCERLINLL